MQRSLSRSLLLRGSPSLPRVGHPALQAGRRQVPGSGAVPAPIPHLPAGNAAPAAPERDLGKGGAGELEREQAKKLLSA